VKWIWEGCWNRQTDWLISYFVEKRNELYFMPKDLFAYNYISRESRPKCIFLTSVFRYVCIYVCMYKVCHLKSNPRNNHALRYRNEIRTLLSGKSFALFRFLQYRRSSLVKIICVYTDSWYVWREGIEIYFYFTKNICCNPHDILRAPTSGSQSIGKNQCSKGEWFAATSEYFTAAWHASTF
jgi:hypothetical protein